MCQRVKFSHTMLSAKSSKLDPTIVEHLPDRPVSLSLGNAPAMTEMKEVIGSLTSEKAAGPGSLPVELLKLDNNDILRHGGMGGFDVLPECMSAHPKVGGRFAS